MRFRNEADEDLVNLWLDRYNRSLKRGRIDPEGAVRYFAEMEQHRRYQVALEAETAQHGAPA